MWWMISSSWQQWRKLSQCCCCSLGCLLFYSRVAVINRIAVEWLWFPVCLPHQWGQGWESYSRFLLVQKPNFLHSQCNNLLLIHGPVEFENELSELSEPDTWWDFASLFMKVLIEDQCWAVACAVLRRSRPLCCFRKGDPFYHLRPWSVTVGEGESGWPAAWYLSLLHYLQ